ncbi:hypothetical protein ElyMa_001946700 [Elysia marginata]|uniref:Uncharacterized protein n=1 Tax=Elysia marginata TaxID=1093978 RepID=A0AAV4EXF3_9GAST|nr:hypothetical protein ElyMa_001946700 [Elysia marginata]
MSQSGRCRRCSMLSQQTIKHVPIRQMSEVLNAFPADDQTRPNQANVGGSQWFPSRRSNTRFADGGLVGFAGLYFRPKKKLAFI